MLGIITNPWKDMQYAINQAQEGDIINVAQALTLKTLILWIKIFLFLEDMHTTIIDGGGLDVVVKIENGYYPRFENFTVTNGYSAENSVGFAGIYTYNNDAKIKNIVLKIIRVQVFIVMAFGLQADMKIYLYMEINSVLEQEIIMSL